MKVRASVKKMCKDCAFLRSAQESANLCSTTVG